MSLIDKGAIVKEPLAPWWVRAHDAAGLVASMVNVAVTRAERDGSYVPPPGVPAPRRRRKAGSLRHLAEVIRTNRLAPGVAVDKDIVAGVLAGDLRHITDKIAVIAVARASHLVAGVPFDAADAARLGVACERVAMLIEQAREADLHAGDRVPTVRAGESLPAVPVILARPGARDEPPEPAVIDAYFPTRRQRPRWHFATVAVVLLVSAVPALVLMNRPPAADAACGTDTAPDEIIDDASTVFEDDAATRLSPTLDFDAMNGSARYQAYQGRTYYWGRAGSDDHAPHSGGARVRWRIADGPWHSCATALAVTERGYVHTPAVPTTIGGSAVTIQVCLWRDEPRRENCTPEISTGR